MHRYRRITALLLLFALILCCSACKKEKLIFESHNSEMELLDENRIIVKHALKSK